MKRYWMSIDYYILPNKILCSMAGVWPINERSSTNDKAFAYFRAFFAFTAVTSVFVPEILAIAVHWGDVKVLAGVGCVSTSVGQLWFKMIYLSVRSKRMSRLYEDMRKLWDISDQPRERLPLMRLAYWARMLTIIFYLSGMCNVITFTLAATVDWIKASYNIRNATDNIKHFPFEVWYGADSMKSPSFEIAFVCQFLASLICCAGICGLDATFMTLILHVCGQFKLIKTWISDIGVKINLQSDPNNVPPSFEVHLNKCIRHHQRMFKIVKEMNNLLSPIIFVQLLTSGLEICLSGFAVIDGATGTELLKFVSYLSSMLIQLIVWCWPAEILIKESQEIGDVIYYDIPWYNLPPFYRKQFCFIIIRAQRHCHVTALTFQVLSIRTLTNVFNTAASYFTLLRQMQYN